MKIAFWSPIHGQTGTTSNILVTAIITGMIYRKKSLLTQTQFSFNNLEAPLVGSNSKNEGTTDYFRDVGLDSLIRSFKAAKLDRDAIENCCISLSNTNLSLLPGTSKNNKDFFEFEMSTVLLNILKTMEGFHDVLFMDISAGDNALSMQIIEDSNLTVVNLNQNMGVVDGFFANHRENIKGKVFYLFGNYDCNSKYNINNIRRRYKEITISNSGVIPYNTSFLDAQCDGKVIDFMKENILCGKNDSNWYFIHKAKSATDKIRRLTGANTNRVERI